MGPVTMTYTHFCLVVLLVPLMRLNGDQRPCPTFCRCTLEILNCSRITNSPGFHQVPLPKLTVHPHPFKYLDFTGNAISSMGKAVWKAYPWAEYLVLKGNSLSRLHNSSLEGLFALTYLDLSCNKIQMIERNAFEAVPLMQIINLSGNVIERITNGTFQAWHNMQFLLKVDLSHNPLAVIQDSYFYSLPSLKFLDLGATEVTPRILEDLLQTSLQLRTLILPQKMSCCLCRIKEETEVLCDTVKLVCKESCVIDAPLCETEEPLNMQEVVMKILETRKLNVSSLLTIMPESVRPSNDMLERAILKNDTLALVQSYSSFAANFNLLKSVKRVMQMKGDEPLDVNWPDKSELKKLDLLARLLEAALKENIMELDKDTLKATVQNEPSAQALEKSSDETTERSFDTSLKKEGHVRKVMRKTWLQTNQRSKASLFALNRNGREFAKTAMHAAGQPSIFEWHNDAESQRKQKEGLDPQRVLSFLGPHQAELQSSWKHSILDSPTNAIKLTGSTTVDKNDNDLTSLSSEGNSVAVFGNGLGVQTLTKEELLNQLLYSIKPPAGDGRSKISAIDSEPSLNELLSDIKLSHGTYWEHQRTSVSPPQNLLLQEDYLLQGDLFEDELNKQLTPLIPNTPARKLISHVIRILKIDCMAPTIQMACAKLISRTGFLMKLFSENINETSSLWKSYFWPSKNVSNITTASSRKLEKPSHMIASQGIPENEHGDKVLLAVSAAAIITIIIALVCLIEICSQHFAAKGRTFLGRRKKPLPDLEHSRVASLSMDKPLQLKDMYQSQDEIQEDMEDKLHDEEPVEEVPIVSWENARPSLSEPPLKKTSSKTLSVPTLGLLPAPTATPPPPSSTPSQKPSMGKGSDTAGGPSEATSSKAADEGDDEDEDSAEKSEKPTTTE